MIPPPGAPAAKATQVRVTQPFYSSNTSLNSAHATDHHQPNDARPSNGPCACLGVALSLLEAINIQSISITRPAISRTLGLNKYILARCKHLLSCERCSTCSSFIMLLIVLSQNLVDAYERVVRLLVQQFKEIHIPSGSVSPRSSDAYRMPSSRQLPGRLENGTVISIGSLEEDLDDALQPRMKLHEYEFDTDEEPAVFGGVTRLQLTLLKVFLERIHEILCSRNLDSHIILVKEVYRRINDQSALFGTRPGRIFDM